MIIFMNKHTQALSKAICIRERPFKKIQTKLRHILKLLNIMKIGPTTLDLPMHVCKDESQNDQRENVCHTSEVETNTEDENTAEINVDIEEEQMTTRV